MNNKLLVEELKRVNEIMGVKTPHNLLLEAWQGALERVLIKMMRYLPRIMENAAFIKLFEDPKLYKKYRDLFDGVTDNEGLLVAIERNYGTYGADEAIKRLLMSNRGTREVLLDIILSGTGKQGLAKYTNLNMLKLMLSKINKMGIPMTQKDFLKITDDYFYKNTNKLLQGFTEKNIVRIAVHNGTKLPKQMFHITKMGSEMSSKGEVLSKLFKEYASTPAEVHAWLKTIDGMTSKTANKIKLHLERGIPIDDPKLLNEVWEGILKHNSQEVKDRFIFEITRNKSMVNQILKGGTDGNLMTKSELAKYLGVKETDEIVTRIMKEVTSTPLIVKQGGPVLRGIWKVIKLPFQFQKWVIYSPFTKKIPLTAKMLLLFRNLVIWYYVMPSSVIFSAMKKWPFLAGLVAMIEGDLDENLGSFEKVLRPDDELQGMVSRDASTATFLENTGIGQGCKKDPTLCTFTASQVYYQAAQDIAEELGTYREILEPEEGWTECPKGEVYYDCSLFDKTIDIFKDTECGTCVKLDTTRDDWETGVQGTGWYSGDRAGLEGWTGTWFWMNHETDELRIKKILNERGSMFGIAKVATVYYQKTGRHLWDDMELMETQGAIASDYYNKFSMFITDVSRDSLLDIVKPFYTYWDGNIKVTGGAVNSKLTWSFPKQLDTLDGEIWKPCWGGRLPFSLQTYLEACDDGNCNTEGIAVDKESDLSKILASDWNSIGRNMLDLKYDLYNRPIVTDSKTKVDRYSPKGSIDYACGGNDRPGEWDADMENALNEWQKLSAKYPPGGIQEQIIGLGRVLKN
tara:strand:- start:1039 stop:3435 length:2397 start_codon:yes stop_codon:yes gene_type:complete